MKSADQRHPPNGGPKPHSRRVSNSKQRSYESRCAWDSSSAMNRSISSTADAQGVVVTGQRIESATVLWTAGVAPAPILKELHAETDRAGRIRVLPTMEVPERPGIFV